MNSKSNSFKRFTFFAVIATVCIFNMTFCNAKTLDFSGMTWTVKSGRGGPGPCNWSENNAWVDSSGQLHLKISKSTDGKWYCGEVFTPGNIGFGEYEWFVIGRVDNFDKNVVLGLFPYGGPDGQNEIDIEMAKWGKNGNRTGNFTVYPAKSGINYTTKTFMFTLSGDYTTHRFNWQSKSVYFQMLNGHRTDNKNQISNWNFVPANYLDYIPQEPMPLHLNLWLRKGLAPSDGKEVEIIIKSFTYTK